MPQGSIARTKHSPESTPHDPQIEELLGWKRDSWVNVNDWAERIHPDDRERVVNYCVTRFTATLAG